MTKQINEITEIVEDIQQRNLDPNQVFLSRELDYSHDTVYLCNTNKNSVRLNDRMILNKMEIPTESVVFGMMLTKRANESYKHSESNQLKKNKAYAAYNAKKLDQLNPHVRKPVRGFIDALIEVYCVK